MAKTKPTNPAIPLETPALTTRFSPAAIQFIHMLQSAVPTTVEHEVEEPKHTITRSWARTALTLLGAARRFIVISAIAFWLGGFTFYAGVAIPTGVEVLGTHKAVGFITQGVTRWLNVAG